MLNKFKNKVLLGFDITLEEAISLISSDLDELCQAANEIREQFCANLCDVCTIINGKSGKCSENCKFCAQSSYYSTDVKKYELLEENIIIESAQYNYSKGVQHYSVVTAGRNLSDGEVDELCKIYTNVKKHCGISLCASHGLLNYGQFLKLKEAGVKRYHNNLETSSRYFPSICTTHTFKDKVKAIKNAQKAGLEVCSGGIIGLGETMQDRIEMAFELRNLGIKSIPINVLSPIPQTLFANLPVLSIEDVKRVVAIYRFINPKAYLRLAGGRKFMPLRGKALFHAGANATITGDFLTESGFDIDGDMKMISSLGFEVTNCENQDSLAT